MTIQRSAQRSASFPEAGDEQPEDQLLDARTAAEMLGIKMQTLYAYVSRGLVRAVSSSTTRGNLYYRQDIESVRLKGRVGHSSGEAVERLMRWGGGAVLQTTITSIGAAGQRYRGFPATDLATMQKPFEDVVELLWSGVLPEHRLPWQALAVSPAYGKLVATLIPVAGQNNTRRLLALSAEMHAASLGGPPERVFGAPILAGRQLLQVLAGSFGLLNAPPRAAWGGNAACLADAVAVSAGLKVDDNVRIALDACLVLSADHELAPSTFAARIAASAGADLYSSAATALGAFEGPLTGLGCDQAEEMLRTHALRGSYIDALRELLRRRQSPPGYGHPLYPGGDPRALHLLALARSHPSPATDAHRVLDAIDAACRELAIQPGLPLGLAAMCAVLGMPARAPGALMALGRSAGWVAHALEQRLAGFLVRPRARYVGPA